MLGRSLKMALWLFHDHLGKFIVAGLLWSAAVAVPLSIAGWLGMSDKPVAQALSVALLLAGGLVVAPAGLAGALAMASQAIDKGDTDFSVFLQGLRQGTAPMMLLVFMAVLAEAVLAVSVWFYRTILGTHMPILGYAIAGLSVLAMLMVLQVALFTLPALTGSKQGLSHALRIAVGIVLDNPFYALWVLAGIVGQLSLVAVPPVFCMVFLGGVACWLAAAYEIIARSYAIREFTATGAISSRVLARLPLLEENGVFYFDESQDDLLNRGVRDFIFPWKG